MLRELLFQVVERQAETQTHNEVQSLSWVRTGAVDYLALSEKELAVSRK